jgi:hypothetical protein
LLPRHDAIAGKTGAPFGDAASCGPGNAATADVSRQVDAKLPIGRPEGGRRGISVKTPTRQTSALSCSSPRGSQQAKIQSKSVILVIPPWVSIGDWDAVCSACSHASKYLRRPAAVIPKTSQHSWSRASRPSHRSSSMRIESSQPHGPNSPLSASLIALRQNSATWVGCR